MRIPTRGTRIRLRLVLVAYARERSLVATAQGRAARGCPFPRTRPASVLAGSVAHVVCGVAAGELLRLVGRSDGSTALDREITSWVVDHPTAGVTTVARSFSLLGSSRVVLPVVASVALALVCRRRFALASLLVVAWGGSIGLYNLTKLVVDRRRPPAGIRLATAAGSSFPSGRATQSLATPPLATHLRGATDPASSAKPRARPTTQPAAWTLRANNNSQATPPIASRRSDRSVSSGASPPPARTSAP
jgi:hypothetical protein